MTLTTIAYVLSGLLAAAIILIGVRFALAPRVAAAGYGVQPDLDAASVRAYMSVKGVRDIASGLIVIVVMIAGDPHLIGWVMLAATIIPITDTAIVLRNGGTRAVALGVHGATAAVMLVTSGLLLTAG